MAEVSPANDTPRRGSAPQKGYVRDATIQPDPVPAVAPPDELAGMVGPANAGELGTGRTFHYEWEDFLGDILDRVTSLELSGGGGGTGTGDVSTVVHVQSTPAATWVMPHALNTKPAVVVVDGSGNQMYVETIYGSDSQVTLVFAAPTAGTAYLRG